MIWAVRAVPVLLIFCTLDLLQRDPPVVFLSLTLVRLALGVGVLLAIRTRRRDGLALAYVVFVFLSSLVNPVRGEQVLLLSAIGLVVIGVDLVRQRRRAGVADRSGESGHEELDPVRPQAGPI
jgi:uncharacterized membrane protein YecN with MAPEG domain